MIDWNIIWTEDKTEDRDDFEVLVKVIGDKWTELGY